MANVKHYSTVPFLFHICLNSYKTCVFKIFSLLKIPFFKNFSHGTKKFSCIKIKKCVIILLIPVPAGSLSLESPLG
jgi:hypothetical protein